MKRQQAAEAPKQVQELVPIDQLSPHPRNANKHPASQIAGLVESIKRLGFYSRVVVDEADRILVGHGRVEALRQLQGAEIPERLTPRADMVPVVRVFGLTEDEKLALMHGDNKHARLSLIAWDSLAVDLKEIAIREPALLPATGFSPDEVEALSFVAQEIDLDKPKAKKSGDGTLYVDLKLRVHPQTAEMFETLMEQAPGNGEAAKFDSLLSCVNPEALKEYVA